MYGILLIIVVIVLSGLIAYLGDQIGMKVGKKRLSLFGLRPKYTSIIITILTGVLIATLTVTVLLATNNGVRQAIFNIREVLNQLDSLNQQLLLKDQDLREMKKEIEDKGEELAEMQELRDQLKERLENTQNEFSQALLDLKIAQNDIKNLEEERKDLEKRIAELNQQRQVLEDRIEELNQEIADVTEDYRRARELASKYQAGYFYYSLEDIVYQRGDIIYTDIIQGGQSQEETIQALKDFLEKANQEVMKRPVKVNEELGTALHLQYDKIFKVASEILNKEDEKVIVRLTAAFNVPKNGVVYADFILDEDFIVFRKGEQIAGKVLDASRPPVELEKELEDLLKDINEKAIQKGLLPDNKGWVGSIDFSQFYQLLKEIQSYQDMVQIKVFASEDIWRENRLSSNLKFVIQQQTGDR